jgi:hypothetical protein
MWSASIALFLRSSASAAKASFSISQDETRNWLIDTFDPAGSEAVDDKRSDPSFCEFSRVFIPRTARTPPLLLMMMIVGIGAARAGRLSLAVTLTGVRVKN